MASVVRGGTQVFRIVKRQCLGGRLVKHLVGDQRYPTAFDRPGIPGITPIGVAGPPVSLPEARMQYEAGEVKLAHFRKQRKAQKLRGRRSSGVLEIVCCGPDTTTSYEERVAWAGECVRFVGRRFGPNSHVAVASLHNDENAPHLHMLVVVVGRNGRLGWSNVRDDVAGVRGKRWGANMSAVQDRFYEEVSSKFGIKRGVKGSGKKNQDIDRAKALPGILSDLQDIADARVEKRERVVTERERESEQAMAAAQERERESEQALAAAQQLVHDTNASRKKLEQSGFDKGLSAGRNEAIPKVLEAQDEGARKERQKLQASIAAVAETKAQQDDRERVFNEHMRKERAKFDGQVAHFNNYVDDTNEMDLARRRAVAQREANVGQREANVGQREANVEAQHEEQKVHAETLQAFAVRTQQDRAQIQQTVADARAAGKAEHAVELAESNARCQVLEKRVQELLPGYLNPPEPGSDPDADEAGERVVVVSAAPAAQPAVVAGGASSSAAVQPAASSSGPLTERTRPAGGLPGRTHAARAAQRSAQEEAARNAPADPVRSSDRSQSAPLPVPQRPGRFRPLPGRDRTPSWQR